MQLREGTAIVRVPEALPASVLRARVLRHGDSRAAVARAAKDRDLDGARVRIHGAGLVGLSAAAIAAEQGATVEVLDPNPERRALAARFGATGLDGEPDVVIEASGHAVGEALSGVAVGGTVVLVGSVFPADPVPFDARASCGGLVTVAGIHNYTGAETRRSRGLLAGRGRAYPFADAVGAVRGLFEDRRGARGGGLPGGSSSDRTRSGAVMRPEHRP